MALYLYVKQKAQMSLSIDTNKNGL